MPKEPNKALRILVPALMMGVGLIIAWSVMRNTTRQTTTAPQKPAPQASPTPAPAPTPEPGAPPQIGASAAQPEVSPGAVAQTPPSPEAPKPASPTAALFAARLYTPVEAGAYTPIGGLAPDQPYVMQIGFSPLGAGISSLDLRDHFETVKQDMHERLQRFHPRTDSPRLGAAPLAMTGVEIDGQFVNLAADPDKEGTYWKEIGPGEFEATIFDGDKPVFRLTRRYRLEAGSYDLVLEQRAENLSAEKHTLTWYQFGPADLPMGIVRYGGDKRRVRFGYLASPRIDPSQQYVESKKFLLDRGAVMGKAIDATAVALSWPPKALWPTDTTKENGFTLVWAAMTNRYFGVALHPIVNAAPGAPQRKAFDLAAKVDRFVLAGRPGPGPGGAPDNHVLVIYLTSVPVTVESGKQAVLDIGVYAGPLAPEYLSAKAEPRAAAVGLDKIVVYTLGGPCGFCTLPPLTRLLHGVLGFLHDYVVRDWAVGILLLVVFVRTCLHPVTRWSQISLQRFGKQMQALAPKQKAIKEKYENDPAKMREEMSRLMREGNVNYAGALGCLPMFLQTPVWIALYAMLFFAFELHHTPAFYGVFQWLSLRIAHVPWTFMADLSEPDHFIYFGGRTFNIPLISMIGLLKDIDGINILPVILGVVFFIQQKYLTPPPTAALTPEQEQQQKIMKVMMVFMFPLVMYQAPCGLALYFICNSTLGIIESRHIRAHVNKMDLLAPKKKAGLSPVGAPSTGRRSGGPAGKKAGFFQRFQEQMEAKRKEFERQRGKGPKRKG